MFWEFEDGRTNTITGGTEPALGAYWLGASIKRGLTLREASAECSDHHAWLVPAISGPWLPGGAAGRAA